MRLWSKLGRKGCRRMMNCVLTKFPFDCITDLVFVEEEGEVRSSDIILVPGGSHTRPMKIAAECYHAGIAPYILPSGGYNSKLDRTEWEHLQRIGLECGVPQAHILKEDQAKNTFDNARNSMKVIQENNLIINSATIVCKSYFSRRALLTYQAIFPPEVKFQVLLDDSRVARDNWYLSESTRNLVMIEAEKIVGYFGQSIPRWVDQNLSST